jgi:hypothetical protein
MFEYPTYKKGDAAADNKMRRHLTAARMGLRKINPCSNEGEGDATGSD